MKKHLFIATLALVTIEGPASGEDQIVVTANRIEQDRDEIGQAITVIDRVEIERLQHLGLTELLTNVPGVRFSRTGGIGQVTGVSLRGAEANQTLVLIDGVKVNDASGTGHLFDFGNLITGNFDRIEVLRGSNSVAHGSQAIGGVIDLQHAAPAPGFSARGSGEYGHADTQSARGEIGLGSEKVSGRAGLSWYRSDAISTAAKAFGATERDGFKNLAANARVSAQLGPVKLDVRAYYNDSKVDYDSFFGAPADSPDRADTQQYSGYAGTTVDLFGGVLKNRVALTSQRTRRDYASPFGDFGFVGKSWRAEYQGIARPAEFVTLTFGYEHEAPRYRYRDAFGSNRARTNVDSVYGLAIVKPVPALSLTAGARYDHHNQFGSETTLGANGNLALFDGVTHIRAAYGEGFNAPSLYQLYDPFSGTATLRPERSRSYDIGVDQALLDERINASLTLFRRTTRDFIDFDFATFTYANVGKTKARGLEFELELRPVDALRIAGNYSYIDAVNDDPASSNFGNDLARRAGHSLGVSIDHDWDFGLSAGTTITHVSSSFSDTANLRRLDGYFLVGLRAAFAISEQIELFGRVDNLADADYASVFGYGTYGRAAYGGLRFRL